MESKHRLWVYLDWCSPKTQIAVLAPTASQEKSSSLASEGPVWWWMVDGSRRTSLLTKLTLFPFSAVSAYCIGGCPRSVLSLRPSRGI
jgi:hypothetical protein